MSETVTAPEWAASLPDDIKSTVTSKGWKDPADAIRSYTNLEKTLGQKRLPAPSQDWKDEQWNSLYKELGRPEKSDDYKVPEHKFPDGVTLDDARLKEARAAMHDAGLLPHQAEKIFKYYFGTVSKEAEGVHEARRREKEAAEFKLKDEWKGDYDLNVKTAKDALSKFGDEETVKYLDESGLGNNPGIIKMLAKIGKGMMEDSARGRADQPGALGADAAQKKIAELRNDTAFMAKFSSGDKEARAVWEEAFKAAYPVEKAT
jgi:hypothetical protein